MPGVLLVILLLAGTASAQNEAYPARPLRLLVGFTAGSASDLMARPLARELTALLGQPVTVENRPGANGALATDATAQSPPDGYTALFATIGQIVINPLLRHDLAADPARDLRPVASIIDPILVMVVPSELPARSFAEFVALARAQPGKLAMGSAGNGDFGHLALELLKQQMGIDVLHVPYRGSGPALQDLLGGRVQLMISPYIVLKGSVEAGRLRALAVTSAQRATALPGIPTVAEAGGPAGFDVVGVIGLYLPAATPDAIASRLEAAAEAALRDGELSRAYAQQGLLPAYRDGKVFSARLVQERERWARLVREARITAV